VTVSQYQSDCQPEPFKVRENRPGLARPSRGRHVPAGVGTTLPELARGQPGAGSASRVQRVPARIRECQSEAASAGHRSMPPPTRKVGIAARAKAVVGTRVAHSIFGEEEEEGDSRSRRGLTRLPSAMERANHSVADRAAPGRAGVLGQPRATGKQAARGGLAAGGTVAASAKPRDYSFMTEDTPSYTVPSQVRPHAYLARRAVVMPSSATRPVRCFVLLLSPLSTC